jgi:agmatine deiminase
MPAEWEPHEATWLAWPHNRTDWPGKFDPIPWVYCDIVYHLGRAERVHILVNDAVAERRAAAALEHANAMRDTVEFHRWPTNRVWTRDYGPMFVKAGHKPPASRPRPNKLAIVDFQFNAWAKYPDWKLDDQIAARAAKLVGCEKVTPTLGFDGRRMVLEGGSIDVNGLGSMLTTEECLLSRVQQRNPESTRHEIEKAFRRYLGVNNVIWLGRGVDGDDTHGHIDDIARFVGPRTVVAAVEPDRSDPNHQPLAENLRRLRAATDQDGKQLDVVELPLPRPIVFREQRLPASYANFYIANGLVLVPTFNDPNDRVALNTLAALFPSRQVVGIHCGDLIWGLGALHCMTQQQPK